MNAPALPPELLPFAALIRRAERGELYDGAFLLPLGNKRYLSTQDANRVITRNVAQTLAEPLAWRVDACCCLLALVQEALCSLPQSGHRTPKKGFP